MEQRVALSEKASLQPIGELGRPPDKVLQKAGLKHRDCHARRTPVVRLGTPAAAVSGERLPECPRDPGSHIGRVGA
jgi:hypothetical protein